MHGTAPPSKPAEPLLGEAPFRLGGAAIDPLTRTLTGPGGKTTVEPRVMHVLVTLARSAGEVVTRDRLLLECWRGRFVGDDALNRAIGEVRRLARVQAAGGFAIETVPRAGYRLTGAAPAPLAAAESGAGARSFPSRRLVLAGGAAAGLAVAAGWALRPSTVDPRARALFDEAGLAMRNQSPGFETRAVDMLGEAKSLAPDDARIAGRLALAWRAVVERAPPARTAAALEQSELAVRRALALDPKQPDARVAQATLGPTFGAWLDVERRLRAVLADDPGHPAATDALTVLLMSVGRVREAVAVNLPAAEADTLSPVLQFRRVYNLWNLGRLEEMDRVADRAVQLWPRHPGVWFVRLWTLAFTGRPTLALAMLDDAEARPALPPPYFLTLRRSFMAIAEGDGQEITRAVAENLAAGGNSATAAVNAVMILTHLGAIDAAFAMTDGYLRRQGRFAGPLRVPPGQPAVTEQLQRKTMMLFVPVTAPLRRDGRFLQLCDAIGLSDYWRESGTRPDFLR